MKGLLFALVLSGVLGFSSDFSAQCDANVTFNLYEMPGCFSWPLEGYAYANGVCADGELFIYSWSMGGLESGTDTLYSASSWAFLNFAEGPSGPTEICVDLVIQDAEYNILFEDSVCQVVDIPPALEICALVTETGPGSCGGCTEVTACNGDAFFYSTVNQNSVPIPISSGNLFCSGSGDYTWMVAAPYNSSYMCSTVQFTVPDYPFLLDTDCSSAILLEPGTQISDTICPVSPEGSATCLNGLEGPDMWYYFNSGTNLGLTIQLDGFNDNLTVVVLADMEGSGCASLTPVDCWVPEQFCISLFGAYQLTPFTDYYIQVLRDGSGFASYDLTIWLSESNISQCGCMEPMACNYNVDAIVESGVCTYFGCTDPIACNYDVVATCDDGTCAGIVGCMDNTACNYNDQATCESGLCTTLCGCTNPTSCNYFPLAEWDDNSCVGLKGCMNPQSCNYNPDATCQGVCTGYHCFDPLACNYFPSGCDGGDCDYSSISGTIFNDLNENGYQNAFENSIGGAVVQLMPGDINVYATNGYFNFPDLPDGDYVITVITYPDGWIPTNTVVATVSDNCAQLHFGFSIGVNDPCFMSGASSPLICTSNKIASISYANYSDEPVFISADISFNDGLIVSEMNNDGEVSVGMASWTVDGFPPNGNIVFQVEFEPPPLDQIGEFFDYSHHIVISDSLGNVLCENWWNYSKQYLCPYDPNEKSATPEGYTDSHLILADDSLVYTIHFQNVGNLTAQDVRIVDSLDIELLDINTFHWLSGSYPPMITKYPSGRVEFFLDNIQLPDSSSNPELSQGYVSYSVWPQPGVQVMDVIHNTARIFFDSNPAVVTNTTWHTIYSCQGLAEFDTPEMVVCTGGDFGVQNTQPNIESYQWTFDSSVVGNDSSANFDSVEMGTHSIALTVSNPLCNAWSVQEIDVVEPPVLQIGETGDNVLSVDGGWPPYQWGNSGGAMEGATGVTFLPIESGTYWVCMSSMECPVCSEIDYVIGMNEMETGEFSISPNPATDNINLQFNQIDGNAVVSILDMNGQVVSRQQMNHVFNKLFTLNTSDLASGMYQVSVELNGAVSTQRVVVNH